MEVFKFGGSSIVTPELVSGVVEIIRANINRGLFVVVSAMGKTTNLLESVVRSYYREDGNCLDRLVEVRAVHEKLISELWQGSPPMDLLNHINDLLVEAEWVIESPVEDSYDYLYDQIVSLGELMSTRIVSSYLAFQGIENVWLDARDVILTDDVYREGNVLWEETQRRCDKIVKPLVDSGQIVVTQGFIGSTDNNYSTTLGREGSDYSAAIFSFCLNAKKMTIWKDVQGVLTGDPKKFEHVTKLDELSYKEAIEMTYYGAKVIHPKTIKPLQNKGIPLYVRSYLQPELLGTKVSQDADDLYPPIVSIESNQVLINISTKDFSFVAEHHIGFLFTQIASQRLRVNLIQNTAISFRVCVTDVDGKVDRFIKSTEETFTTKVEKNLELITIRHFNSVILDHLKSNKMVLLENKFQNTFQMVTKNLPSMKRIE